MVPYTVQNIYDMTKNRIKIYIKLKKSPTNATYSEICQLAEHAGFVFRKQKGSHKIYKHPSLKGTMNFQSDKKDKSKAKKYQVSQLIDFIDRYELIKKEK